MVELKSYIYSRRIKINFRQVSQFVLLDTFNSMSLGDVKRLEMLSSLLGVQIAV